MGSAADRLTPVSERLGRLRNSIKSLFFLDGVSRLAFVTVAFLMVTFIIDWSLHLPAPVRLVLLGGGVLLFLWIVARRLL